MSNTSFQQQQQSIGGPQQQIPSSSSSSSLGSSQSNLHTSPPLTKIIDIKPYAKGINSIFIVLEKGNAIKKKDGFIYQVLVADNTACINMTLFDVLGEQVQPGDILRLRGGYATIFHELLNLYVGKSGGIIEKIGEFQFSFVEHPNLSHLQWTQDPNNPKTIIGIPPKQFGGPIISAPFPTGAKLNKPPPQQQQQQQQQQPPQQQQSLPQNANLPSR
ncbi:OB fold-containing protein [Cavenderia fasciculata]|uniref:OB fold-containing protein n=1 Tax=Cavenderia fasciculata TaxID=261658 RepID=F4Q7Q3_CACFS|nr:OB fold-containing protein [Cavenderia fasciculata]EGG15803.1 OB fold-containing protein [Cavenderia fasciculata]|eukprot:XP_004352128.1 OB fold-containing protein [Cavenderia fasciculata]